MSYPHTTKIIFLDMDGVINCSDERVEHVIKDELWAPYLIDILNGLSEIEDVKVVLSSVWRLYYFDTPEKVNELFTRMGIKLECIGVTPSGGYCRGEEIQKWVEQNITGQDHWLYSRYVIVDDDSDMLLCQKNNFFPVDSSVGITRNVVYKINRYFQKFN